MGVLNSNERLRDENNQWDLVFLNPRVDYWMARKSRSRQSKSVNFGAGHSKCELMGVSYLRASQSVRNLTPETCSK